MKGLIISTAVVAMLANPAFAEPIDATPAREFASNALRDWSYQDGVMDGIVFGLAFAQGFQKSGARLCMPGNADPAELSDAIAAKAAVIAPNRAWVEAVAMVVTATMTCSDQGT